MSNSDPPYPPGLRVRHPEYTWPISPAPVVCSQTSFDGKLPRNRRASPGRRTACGCAPARISGEISALVFKTPGIYFKKIQLLFTLRWPLALHDIMLVSCRINLPAIPSFTQDIYLILWKPGAQLKKAKSTRIPFFARDLPRHRKLLQSNCQLKSCVYIPCLQGHLKASCSLQLKSEQTNAAIPTHLTKKMS